LLGRLTSDHHDDEHVFLNTNYPFALVTCGVQGSGKSHTLGCLIENCMIAPKIPKGLIKLRRPMTTLVFHFDQSPTNVCEATGLIEESATIKPLLDRIAGRTAGQLADASMLEEDAYFDANDLVANEDSESDESLELSNPAPPLPRPQRVKSCLDKSNMVVLVSPSYYHQRKHYYGDYCTVKPLLFSWQSLTAKQIKSLMRINPEDNQLYVSVMLDLLRRYQRDNLVPNFADFLAKLENECSNTQASPLRQRKALLESIIFESSLNIPLREHGGNLTNSMKPGDLVIVDLTDPLLSSNEANGIFEVLLEQFRTMKLGSR